MRILSLTGLWTRKKDSKLPKSNSRSLAKSIYPMSLYVELLGLYFLTEPIHHKLNGQVPAPVIP